jgi:hypothetical protein
MRTSFNEKLIGQVEEGIEKVEWKPESEIENCLLNSYENIKLLFEK